MTAIRIHFDSISTLNLLNFEIAEPAASVITIPKTTPASTMTIASCSIIHAIAGFDIPRALSIPICLVRSVTAVYIASSITRMLIANATETTIFVNT